MTPEEIIVQRHPEPLGRVSFFFPGDESGEGVAGLSVVGGKYYVAHHQGLPMGSSMITSDILRRQAALYQRMADCLEELTSEGGRFGNV